MNGNVPDRFSGTLEVVHESIGRLLSTGPLQRLRVRAGDVAIELEWPRSEGRHDPVEAGSRTVEADSGTSVVDDRHYVCAPTVGTFYYGPAPGAEPFVRERDLVDRGDQVGILEVMKLMMPVEADCPGRVVEMVAADAEPVEYGQRLVAIETPSGADPPG